MAIVLKSPDEIATIAEAGRIIARVFDHLTTIVVSGKTTEMIGAEIEQIIVRAGGRPAFLGYRGFPKPVCISINDEVVHGIPGPRRISQGDLVKIDVGVEYRSYYADAARTILVGKNERGLRLLRATREALDLAIKAIRVGGHLGEISAAIERCIKGYGYSVVRELTGHGIGSSLHEDPPVPNFATPDPGPELEPGMVLAIEPMVNEGSWETILDRNGWTVLTKDGSLSAHFEDTVAITEDGVKILTRRC
ncbi:type I methionyl aminopeptidase [candidate division WOR-3 bacterium]|uniref:Methionine aminopeptidase n=1 Tax=candidate division WOR-3 bacterium TaxID=2052148 RepID=A0A660SL76_UNCW3|nr:MAG: type I methionyl aminopeptidase [candidate division WOR-3 bacterium]